jgi:hypothetical protein
MKDKHFFKFAWFEELQIGEVFKFSPDSVFYSVIKKNEVTTTFQTLYGKLINQTFRNDVCYNKEVLIFPDRQRNYSK